jgi:hypothetical protein
VREKEPEYVAYKSRNAEKTEKAAVKKPTQCEKGQIHREETGFFGAVVKFSRSIVNFKTKL